MSEEEIETIKLINNTYIFSKLVINKDYLKFKNNIAIIINASRREDIFIKISIIVILIKINNFRTRAKTLRVKIIFFIK